MLRLMFHKPITKDDTMGLRTVKAIILTVSLILLFTTASFAGFIDFEDGVDGEVIASTIEGMEFTNTEGYDWIYGDWRTNEYNGCYPNHGVVDDWNWPRPLGNQFYSDGDFFGWMGAEQGIGVITFTEAYATFFEIGYSTSTGITLEAYDEYGSLLDSDTGVNNNTGTGQLYFLHVDAPGMAYVTLSGTSNNWLVDNLFTDAIMQCKCDDHCQDGNFCTGEKVCDLEIERCQIQGDPCGEGFTCNEETDSCEEDVVSDDDDDGDDDDIPEDDDDDLPEDDDDSVDGDDDSEPSDDDSDSDDDDDSSEGSCCG